MLMKRIAIVLIAALVPLLSSVAQETPPVVSLQQSIDAALSSGDDLKVLQGSLDVARAQHALNVSKNSFTLGASAGYGAGWSFGAYGTNPTLKQELAGSLAGAQTGPLAGIVLSGPLTSLSVSSSPYMPPATGGTATDTLSGVGVSLSQTLWNGYPGGAAQATVDKSTLTLQGKELSTESGRLGLIYGVKQAYYTMLSAQRDLSLKKQILEKQNAVLRQISGLYDLKLATVADLKTAQFNAQSAQADVDGSQYSLRFARITLATFMGMPAETGFSVAETDDPVLPAATEDEAVSVGLSRRVEIKQVELNIKSSNVDLAVARGQATPTLSVTGGLNWLYDWTTGPTSAGVASAGVKIAMPVLDAGAVKNQVDAIVRQNQVYAVQEAQFQKSITTGIKNAWEGVQLARERAAVAALNVEATSLQLQLVSAQRDAGTASNQDYLTAAVNLANAQNAANVAKSAAQLAVLQLQSLMGY
jgi:outer membrane protein